MLIGTCFSRAKQRAVPSHTHAHAAAFSGGSTATNPYPPTLYFQTFLHAVDTYFRKQFLLRAEMTETTARQDL